MQFGEKSNEIKNKARKIAAEDASIDESEKKDNPIKRLVSFVKSKLSEKGEREVRLRLQRIVRFLAVVATAYLLSGSKIYFGVYPMALALICSSGRHIPAVAIGIALSILGGAPPIYGYICIAMLFARVLIVLVPMITSDISAPGREKSKEIIKYNPEAVESVQDEKNGEKSDGYIINGLGKIFGEKLYVRVLLSAVGGSVCGLILLLGGGFSFYNACATLLLTVASPIFTLALSGVFGESGGEKSKLAVVSLGVIFFFCVYGARGQAVLGMPLAPCIATALTLYVCSLKGMLWGALAGIVSSVAFDVYYLPLLLISAVVFCLISAVKRNAGIAAVCGLALLWCYYIGGAQGLIGVLPPMLLAIPIYMLADKYREMMSAPYKNRGAAEDGLYFATAVTEQDKNAAVKERLSVLSDTFTSLSETFYKLSHRFRRSDTLGIRRITDSSFERICEGCRERERCWGSEMPRTLEAVKHVSAGLHGKGSVSEKDLPDDFLKSCPRCDKLINEINERTRAATENMINGGRASFFASNYDDITAILKDALSGDGDEYECDLEAGEKVLEFLCSRSIGVGGVAVYGKRCRRVVAKGVTGIETLSAEDSERIRLKVGEIVGCELTLPTVEVGKDGNVMTMYSRPTVKATCAHGRVSRSGGEFSSCDEKNELYIDPFEDENELCGDMTEAFITDNSYFYALISDGMGSGAEAAYTSGVSAMFIEKMLMAGNRADITIRMLNNVIRSENMGCGEECSATVDLLELDLMSGTAAFIKSGAAPTYIAREGTVYKVSSRTMPVGIIKDADARITKFDTKKGDIIVMMSDGCCHDSDDCPWLVEYLCSYMTRAKRTTRVGDGLCETLKDEIIREALKNAPESEERDDISVSVTVIG